MTDTEVINTKEIKQFSFSKGDVLFSILLNSVVEVQEGCPITEIPWKQKGLLGMTGYRGYLIPVLDPCQMSIMDFGEKFQKQESIKSIVIVESNQFKVAFVLSKFYKILSGEDPKPESLEDGLDKDNFIYSMTIVETKAMIFLNVDSICKFYKQLLKKQSSLVLTNKQKVNILESNKNELVKLLFFSIGENQLCIPIGEVEEILENFAVTPLFKVHPMLCGLINLRGKVIACLDISGFLGMPPVNLNENTKFILLQKDSIELSICVDTIYRMNEFNRSSFVSPDGILSSELSKLSVGTSKLDDKTLVLLSTEKIARTSDLQKYTELHD
jgi:purine-binding chemotaxis protein CheW